MKSVFVVVLFALGLQSQAFAQQQFPLDKPEPFKLRCNQIEPISRTRGVHYAITVAPVVGTADLVDLVLYTQDARTSQFSFVDRQRLRWSQEDVQVWMRDAQGRVVVSLFLDEFDQTTLNLRNPKLHVNMDCERLSGF